MNEIPMGNASFQAIVKFYLLECPVRTYKRKRIDSNSIAENVSHKYEYVYTKVSKRGKTLKERGIDGSKLNTFRASMRRVAKNIVLDAPNDIEIKKEQLRQMDEYLIVKGNEENCSITEGYFYFIRNAFAHGSFDVVDGYFYLENHKNGKLRGVGKLSETTLLKWIELTEMPIEKIKNAGIITNRSNKMEGICYANNR